MTDPALTIRILGDTAWLDSAAQPPIRVEPDIWRIVTTVSNAMTTLLLIVLVIILWRSNHNLRKRFHRIGDDAERLIVAEREHGKGEGP